MSEDRVENVRLDGLRDDGLITSESAVRELRTCLDGFLTSTYSGRDDGGVVLHLRGDVSSTVVAALAVDALGSDRVKGLIMPSQLTDEAAARHAEVVGEMLGIGYRRLQLRPLLSSFQQVIGAKGEPADDVVALRALRDRFRTACLHYVAMATNASVLGSTDRTTRLLRESANHSSGDVDIAVLADLYESEVRHLARHLQLPAEIMDASERTPSDAFSRDLDGIDLEPETVDRVLYWAVDAGETESATASRAGVDPESVRTIRQSAAVAREHRFTPHTLSEWLHSGE